MNEYRIHQSCGIAGKTESGLQKNLKWKAIGSATNRRSRLTRNGVRLQQRYQKVALLIVDELGFVPFERAGGELLFNLLAQRYERRSTIITTNLAFSEWVKVFADEKLTTALLDRLTHHAHILTTRGDSYRANKRKADADNRAPPNTNNKQ